MNSTHIPSFSTFLFADPSFWEGFGRAVDIGGVFPFVNGSASDHEADTLAAFADWAAVGHDLRTAAKQFAEQHQDAFRQHMQAR